ncbi:baseplate J/gp47 family protein [Clostridium estertheticum]|uniref:baseplate J/gp47 family protein n=1 Tax=Clostridium estertheticum TaxID=238834 RepID=UPI001C6E1909|nr:baseplate J/gp47 family protein [Clostridium estertheticum]MBW9170786.1 baseplate J/gp47 family protein [Clostridium estertheticum]WLC74375.1 baseplate J/gp47 family protein [Clostridium estertheticum]
MYEDKTIANIKTEMMDDIDDSYEKTEGNPTADIIESFAIQSGSLWSALQYLYNKVDIDLLVGNDLTKYVLQRKAIVRKVANRALAILTITGNGNIKVGDLFSTKSNIQFVSLEDVTIVNSATINVQAVLAGIIGNVGANSIIQFPVTIAGILSCNNPLASYDGFEEEDDDTVRERYYQALQVAPTSGNIFHYELWAKACKGVGDCRVLPLWNGDNTVKVIIIDSNKQVASQTIIDSVQNDIDPKGIYDSVSNTWSTWGTGTGEAPVGAYCTVVTATDKPINISVNVVESLSFSLDTIMTNISTSISNYLASIAFKENYISYAKVSAMVLDTVGVLDFTDLKVNGGTVNITVGNEEVAMVGEVTAT